MASLTECVNNLSDDDVKFLHPRFAQRLSGDLAAALSYVARISEIDRMFSNTVGANQLYDAIDVVSKEIEKEFRKRPHLMVEDKPERRFKKKPYNPKFKKRP